MTKYCWVVKCCSFLLELKKKKNNKKKTPSFHLSSNTDKIWDLNAEIVWYSRNLFISLQILGNTETCLLLQTHTRKHEGLLDLWTCLNLGMYLYKTVWNERPYSPRENVCNSVLRYFYFQSFPSIIMVGLWLDLLCALPEKEAFVLHYLA